MRFVATVILVVCLFDQVACFSAQSTNTGVVIGLSLVVAVCVRRSTRCCDTKATLPY